MILKARRSKYRIQRVFSIDTIALDKSYALIEQTSPDYIELLPGIISEMNHEVHGCTKIPVITGRLVRSEEHVQ